MRTGLSAARYGSLRLVPMAVICACGALAACDPPAQTRTMTPAGTPLRVADAGAVRIGVEAGDSLHELHDVRTPFLLPDGRIVVPQGEARNLRVFDARGNFLASLGRAGAGPGEFRSLVTAWARGDTIEAYDGSLQRVTRFVPGGAIDVIVLLEPPRSAQVMLPAAFSDGWLISGVASASVPGRDQIVVHHVARDGSFLGEIAHSEGIVRVQTPSMTGPAPLSPRVVLRAHRGELYVAETLTPQIDVYATSGTQLRRIAWDMPQRESPSAALQRVVAAALTAAPPEQMAEVRARIEHADLPQSLPVFWDFHVDELGFVWIRSYDPVTHAAALGGLGPGAYTLSSPKGGQWRIYSPAGDPVGTFPMPDGMRPAQITATALVGVHYDELGVESVVVHPLIRQ
jgi:hypothetical protein